MCNLFGVVVLHRSILDWRGSICHGHMCILLYAKLIRCNVYHINLWSIGGGERGQSAMDICAFCYI